VRRRPGRHVASLGFALVAIIVVTPSSPGALGDIVEFRTRSGPTCCIVGGPDGALWFGQDSGQQQLGRITTLGKATQFNLPGPMPSALADGPDGSVWFVVQIPPVASQYGRMSQTGGATWGWPYSELSGIAAGPDGSMWMTNASYPGTVARATTDGVVMEVFDIPTVASEPGPIVAGPDGNLWFLETAVNQIARMSTSGAFTEFPLNGDAGALTGLAVGPDGNLWVSESNDLLARVTTAGAVTADPVASSPNSVTAGWDGKIWYTAAADNRIGSIGTDGTGNVEFDGPPDAPGVNSMTAGPDGNLWFAESVIGFARVGKVSDETSKSFHAMVLPSGFSPRIVRVAGPGSLMTWGFYGSTAASATDATGLGLFDSGPELPVSFSSYVFGAAGSFLYEDGLMPTRTGSVQVPVRVTLSEGMTAQADVLWSTRMATGSTRFDVQVEQPGSAVFVDWLMDQTGRSQVFGPTDPLYVGPGTYAFRARVRDELSGATSGYSPPRSVVLG
jgi:streptogramin lyase